MNCSTVLAKPKHSINGGEMLLNILFISQNLLTVQLKGTSLRKSFTVKKEEDFPPIGRQN